MGKTNPKKNAKKPSEDNMIVDSLEIDEGPKTPPPQVKDAEPNQVIKKDSSN